MEPTAIESRVAEIAVGQRIGPWEREATVAAWNRYAAVNDEFVPMHMENDAARAAGMPSAFGMGNLLIAYANAMLRDWLDGRGRILSLEMRFRRPSLPGRVIVAGEITALGKQTAAGQEALVEITVVDGTGETLAPAQARVLLHP